MKNSDYFFHVVRPGKHRFGSVAGIIVGLLSLGVNLESLRGAGEAAVPAPGGQRKAVIFGSSDTSHGLTHPQVARLIFLRCVGNPENDPAKGWTCDFTDDLIRRFGMNVTNTSAETLFNYLGQHHLGYRIAIACGPTGNTLSFWGSAVDNGIMPFAPQGDNNARHRLDDPIGLRIAVGVAGGITYNLTSYGPGVELVDFGSREDYAQSWANQGAAAKYAHILDAHPDYNIWDAREHLRQAASVWARGWTETNGYGVADEHAAVGHLLPAPPVEFSAVKTRDNHQVKFSWRNFLQTGFAGVVVARQDGRVVYEGKGTNFTWTTDVDGAATFVYWARNTAGEKSRMETYQTRTVSGLRTRPTPACLVFGALPGDENASSQLFDTFQKFATNWNCDLAYRTGNAYYDQQTNFPIGQVVTVQSNFSAMVTFAISNHYRLILAPATYSDGDLYRFKADWDRATAAGIVVVLPHHPSPSTSRSPQARRLSPPCLFSGITVGEGTTKNIRTFGPGLEFFDSPGGPSQGTLAGEPTENEAAGVVGAKLARLLDANPRYNNWDARQHLRQSSSYYSSGWVEDGGYGRPAPQPVRLAQLDPAPPLEIHAEKSADGTAVQFSWRNFLQSSFAETVIQGADGAVLYHGTGTNFVWPGPLKSDQTFRFFSKDKTGKLSRGDAYTIVRAVDIK